MDAGDLIRLKDDNLAVGFVVYKHPTKGVVRVLWSDVGYSWESCARLEIICRQRVAKA